MRPGPGWASLAVVATLLSADAGAAPSPSVSIRPAVVEYEESLQVFPNPERGWFWPFNPECCGTDRPHAPLEVDVLRELRARPEAITLIRDGVQLGRHLNGPLSDQTLGRIRSDWNAARQAGVKVIVRFLYDWSRSDRDPEESIMERHLGQLAPLLAENEDVIAMVEAGLFGGSGEANRSEHGYVDHDPGRGGWQRLSPAGIRMYRKLLSVIPASRPMLVRYPRFKWDLMGWSPSTARPGAERRIGYYDDGWFGDDRHFAFFQLPNERSFTEEDTRHVIMGGEPSMATATNRDAAAALREMAALHQTTLNLDSTDARPVYERWRLGPEWAEMSRRLGYRIVLLKAALRPASPNRFQATFSAELVNRGFAPLMSWRPAVLVLRDRATGSVTRVPLSLDLRRVEPGGAAPLVFSEDVPLPREPAEYDVGLHFPDPSPRIAARPAYALRLATRDIWDPVTSIHWLGVQVSVRS